MEGRLKLAKELLNPDDSVLIVTIEEKEYLRLGLLLEQTFGGARIQMVSVTISPRGTSREAEFSRVDGFLFGRRLRPGQRELRHQQSGGKQEAGQGTADADHGCSRGTVLWRGP